MKLKYMIVGFIAGVFAATAITAGASTVYEKFTAVARPDYKLVVDGSTAKLNNSPVTINGNSYLPVREVATLLDTDVSFNSGIIELTTKQESEGGNMLTETVEWISLRELATIGVDVQVGPEHNVMTISNGQHSIKIYTTDVIENQTTEVDSIDGVDTVTVKSDKGFTYLKKSELQASGIID